MIQVSARTWKRFPHYMIGTMLMVAGVNVWFISAAVRTFPGTVSNDDFDTSNRYNAVLAAAAAQDALGWTERAAAEHGTPTIDIANRDGRALTGATVEASAERPVGNDTPVQLAFREARAGHYVASTVLGQPGQWDLKLRARLDRLDIRVTRRIVVR